MKFFIFGFGPEFLGIGRNHGWNHLSHFRYHLYQSAITFPCCYLNLRDWVCFALFWDACCYCCCQSNYCCYRWTQKVLVLILIERRLGRGRRGFLMGRLEWVLDCWRGCWSCGFWFLDLHLVLCTHSDRINQDQDYFRQDQSIHNPTIPHPPTLNFNLKLKQLPFLSLPWQSQMN